MGMDLSAPIQYLFGVGYYLSYILEMMILIILVYFVGKRKFMIEIKPSLDFQESIFPNVKKNYFDEINRVLHIRTEKNKEEQQEENPAPENAESPKESEEEDTGGHLERLFPTSVHADLAIHDAPLWLISYMSLLALVAIYNVIRFFTSTAGTHAQGIAASEKLINFDFLAQNVQNFLQKAVGTALPSLNGYLLSLLFYTLILTLLLMILAKVYFHLLKLNQLQVLGKSSEAYVKTEKLWNVLGFSHTTRLEHGVSQYLLFPGALYFVVTLVLDYYVFMGKIQIADLHFAMMHLFYIFVPRFFSELFDFPVHFVRRLRQEKHKVPWSILPDWLKEAGVLPVNAVKTVPAWEQEEMVADSSEFVKARQYLETPFYKDVLNTLGISDLYRHQYRVWELSNIQKKNLIMATPFNSGRTTVALLSVLQEAAVNGNGVLYLHPDREAVTAAYEQFCSILKKTIYFRYVSVFNMTEPGFLSQPWEDRFPQVLFADFSSLEKHLLSSWQARDLFFENLKLTVLEDMEQTAGITATNLYFFFKRFSHLKRKQTDMKVRYLLTLPPVFNNYDIFETLLSTSFTYMEIDTFLHPNGTEVYTLSGDDSVQKNEKSPNYLPDITGKLLKGGYYPVVFSDTVTEYQIWQGLKENDIPLRLKSFYRFFTGRKQVSVLDVRFNNVLRLLQQAKGIGEDYVNPSARIFAVYGADPFLEFLFENQLHGKEADKGSFVFSDSNQNIATETITTLLSVTPLEWWELCGIFGERLVTRVFKKLRNKGVLLSDADQKYYIAQGVSETDFHTAAQNTKQVVLVKEDETEDLFTIDALQARSFLYPGKIFTHMGKRLKVPLKIYDELEWSKTIELQPLNDFLQTNKKAQYELDILFSPNDRLLECRQGSLPFYYFSTSLRIKEEIYGYRQWLNGQFHAEFNYSSLLGQSVVNSYTTPGLLLYFHENLFSHTAGTNAENEPVEGQEIMPDTPTETVPFTEEEKHKILLALSQLLLKTIGAYLYVTDDMVEVIVPDRLKNMELFLNPENNTSLTAHEIISVFDVFPGGAGYVKALTPERIFTFFRIIRRFLVEKSPDLNDLLILQTRRDTIPLFEDTDLDNLKEFLSNLLSLNEAAELKQVQKEVFNRLNKDIFDVQKKAEEQHILESLPQRIKKDYHIFKSIGEEIEKQWPA